MNQPRGLLKLLKLDSLINTIIDYAETRIGLVQAEVKDTIMAAMRAAMIYGSIAVLALFFVLFLSLTIALALNALLDSIFWGFAIVTGLYLIMAVTFYLLRDSEKVKMMFGDGSLAFLKAKKGKDTKEEQPEEREEKSDQEAAAEERQGRMEHEHITFEHNQRSNGKPTPAGRPADIHIEKKEGH